MARLRAASEQDDAVEQMQTAQDTISSLHQINTQLRADLAGARDEILSLQKELQEATAFVKEYSGTVGRGFGFLATFISFLFLAF